MLLHCVPLRCSLPHCIVFVPLWEINANDTGLVRLKHPRKQQTNQPILAATPVGMSIAGSSFPRYPHKPSIRNVYVFIEVSGFSSGLLFLASI